MNLEQISLIVLIITNIITAIALLRRRPPIEAEFVSWKALKAHCALMHLPVKTDEELRMAFVDAKMYAREIEERDAWRKEVNEKLDKQMKGLVAMAANQGVEIEL